MIDHPLVLSGQSVRLEPLEPHHIPALMAIAQKSPEEYRYTSTPVTEAQQDKYFEAAFKGQKAGTAYPFVLLDARTSQIIGSSRYSDIIWRHRNCELGYTWLDPAYQGSAVNVESKFLMLEHAFETLKFLRVQIHTDTRNTRSQKAIEALGATFEGVLRRHMVAKDGFVRDTNVYSVVDTDWPEVKKRLEERVAQKLAWVNAEG